MKFTIVYFCINSFLPSVVPYQLEMYFNSSSRINVHFGNASAENKSVNVFLVEVLFAIAVFAFAFFLC